MISTASKNGHPIPTSNGTGFENGARVQITNFDYDESDRQFAEQQREIGRREVMADLYQVMIQRALDLIIADSNPKLSADSFKFAAGTIEESEVEIADKYGVGKAAVSKRVKQWQELLNLPPAAAMRSNKACETFSRKTLKSWKRRSKPENQPAPKPNFLQRISLAPV